MGEDKKALKSFKRSLRIIPQLKFNEGIKEEKEKQLLMYIQNLSKGV